MRLGVFFSLEKNVGWIMSNSVNKTTVWESNLHGLNLIVNQQKVSMKLTKLRLVMLIHDP